jgi:hypothetical protein
VVLRRLHKQFLHAALERGARQATPIDVTSVEQRSATAPHEAASGSIHVRPGATERLDDLQRGTSCGGVRDDLHAQHRGRVLEPPSPRQQRSSPSTGLPWYIRHQGLLSCGLDSSTEA